MDLDSDELKQWIRENVTIRVKESGGYYGGTLSFDVELCFMDQRQPCDVSSWEVFAEASFSVPTPTSGDF